jgi:hypothetical protein
VPTSIWLGVLLSVLLLVGYAFDSADGQLARPARRLARGEWLDHVTDAGRNLLLHCAVLVAWVRFHRPARRGAAAPARVDRRQRHVLLRRDAARPAQPRPGRKRVADSSSDSLVRSLVLMPIDYSSLCLAFLFLGLVPVFVVVYGVLLLINALFALRALRKTTASSRHRIRLRDPAGAPRRPRECGPGGAFALVGTASAPPWASC